MKIASDLMKQKNEEFVINAQHICYWKIKDVCQNVETVNKTEMSNVMTAIEMTMTPARQIARFIKGIIVQGLHLQNAHFVGMMLLNCQMNNVKTVILSQETDVQ